MLKKITCVIFLIILFFCNCTKECEITYSIEIECELTILNDTILIGDTIIIVSEIPYIAEDNNSGNLIEIDTFNFLTELLISTLDSTIISAANDFNFEVENGLINRIDFIGGFSTQLIYEPRLESQYFRLNLIPERKGLYIVEFFSYYHENLRSDEYFDNQVTFQKEDCIERLSINYKTNTQFEKNNYMIIESLTNSDLNIPSYETSKKNGLFIFVVE